MEKEVEEEAKKYPDPEEYLDQIAEEILEGIRVLAKAPLDKILMGIVLVRAGSKLQLEGMRDWKFNAIKFRKALEKAGIDPKTLVPKHRLRR